MDFLDDFIPISTTPKKKRNSSPMLTSSLLTTNEPSVKKNLLEQKRRLKEQREKERFEGKEKTRKRLKSKRKSQVKSLTNESENVEQEYEEIEVQEDEKLMEDDGKVEEVEEEKTEYKSGENIDDEAPEEKPLVKDTNKQSMEDNRKRKREENKERIKKKRKNNKEKIKGTIDLRAPKQSKHTKFELQTLNEEEKKLSELLFNTEKEIEFNKDDQNNRETMYDNEDEEIRDNEEFQKSLRLHEYNKKIENNMKHYKLKGLKEAWIDDERSSIDIFSRHRLFKLRDQDRHRNIISAKEYERRLKNQYKQMYGDTPEWAQITQVINEKKEDELDTLLQNTSSLIYNNGLLPKKTIDILKQRNANVRDCGKGRVNSVQFHDSENLLLTAGIDCTLRFFQIDGDKNTKLQSVLLKDFPILNSFFIPNQSEIFCSGKNKPHFYSIDLETSTSSWIHNFNCKQHQLFLNCIPSPCGNYLSMTGKDGHISIASTHTKQIIKTFRTNNPTNCLAFTNDSKYLLSGCDNGEIYIWDMNTSRCYSRFMDQGSLSVSSMSISPDGKSFASGSTSGVVNYYDMKNVMEDDGSGEIKEKVPSKSFMSITTKIKNIHFNHDSQIMAYISSEDKNLAKMINTNSLTIFENFPKGINKLETVTCFNFSHDSKFAAFGTSYGPVQLFKLNYYSN